MSKYSISIDVRDISIAAIVELKHPSVLNFGTIADTIIKQNPLIKNKKMPKVKIVIGIEKKIRIGLTKRFTNAKTKATRIAEMKLSTTNNLVILPTKYIENAKINNLIIKSCIYYLSP